MATLTNISRSTATVTNTSKSAASTLANSTLSQGLVGDFTFDNFGTHTFDEVGAMTFDTKYQVITNVSKS